MCVYAVLRRLLAVADSSYSIVGSAEASFAATAALERLLSLTRQISTSSIRLAAFRYQPSSRRNPLCFMHVSATIAISRYTAWTISKMDLNTSTLAETATQLRLVHRLRHRAPEQCAACTRPHQFHLAKDACVRRASRNRPLLP